MSTDPFLGEGYTAHRIDLGADDEGPLIAVLVHRDPPLQAPTVDAEELREGEALAKPPILMMHGWSDYVFDRELMEHLGRSGHDVWGLDLRKYGRSLLPGQTATAIDHLNRYDDEIGASLRIIGAERPPILLAHSTGGLIAALWAQRNPGTVRGLALNSPWLEMHLGPVTRSLAEAPVRLLADRLRERPILPFGRDHYARTTHRDFGGPYDYDLTLKPAGGHRLPAATLSAIIDGQRRLAAAGPLSIPVLVMHSARSRIGPRFTEEMRRADSVLDVKSLAAASAGLGPDVRIEAIEGARHDVFLSDADARSRAMAILDEWLEKPPLAAPTMRAPDGRAHLGTPVPGSHAKEEPDDRGSA